MLSNLFKPVLLVLAIIQGMMGYGTAMDMHKNVDIAIIGGGMAGLTTAYNLNKKGVMVELFEAKDHLGGRTFTHYFNKDQYYEEGGTVIDADHFFVIDLAHEIGVNLEEVSYADGRISGFWDRRQLTSSDLLESLGELITQMNNPQNYGNKRSLNDVELSPRTKAYLKNYIMDECGIELEDCPTSFRKWVAEESEIYKTLIENRECWYMPNCVIGLVGYFYRVAGGMSQFVKALEKACQKKEMTKFNTGYILKSIKYQGNEYYLTFDTKNGPEIIIAKRVVMTIPFSTLRDVEGIETIGLSDMQLMAIQKIIYGTNAKIGIPVTGSFDMRFYLSLDQNFNAWPGHKSITIMLGGENGRNIGKSNKKSAEEFVNAETENFYQTYPKIGKFGEIAYKNWSEDPFAKGSYSAKTTRDPYNLWYFSDNFIEIFKYEDKDGKVQEGTTYLVNKFAEPINDNSFIFAGEHTRWGEDRAYIEGAVQSGVLAAQLILGEDTKVRYRRDLPLRLQIREKF